VSKRTTVPSDYATDRRRTWNKCRLNHRLECLSLLNTHLSHSRSWLNIQLTHKVTVYGRGGAGFFPKPKTATGLRLSTPPILSVSLRISSPREDSSVNTSRCGCSQSYGKSVHGTARLAVSQSVVNRSDVTWLAAVAYYAAYYSTELNDVLFLWPAVRPSDILRRFLSVCLSTCILP